MQDIYKIQTQENNILQRIFSIISGNQQNIEKFKQIIINVKQNLKSTKNMDDENAIAVINQALPYLDFMFPNASAEDLNKFKKYLNYYPAEEISGKILDVIDILVLNKTALSEQVFADYDMTRKVANKNIICYAPFTSLYFDISGDVNVCCANASYTLGSYPQQSIADCWYGDRLKDLRAALARKDFQYGCYYCASTLAAKNFESSMLNHYDHLADKADNQNYPVIFEFELSNICNYECIMCCGRSSSMIRKNREGLPPIKPVYDKKFVEQVAEFLPHLQKMNFLGGEPFLIPVYYDIWEKAVKLNPKIELVVTSNGSTLPIRAKELMSKLENFRVVLSIDSLQKKTYELIRKNGRFENVQKNLKYFIENNKLSTIAVSPMLQNWQDIPEIVNFCQDNNIDLHFNIVRNYLGGKVKDIHVNGEQDFIWSSKTEFSRNYRKLSELITAVTLKDCASDMLYEIIDFYNNYSFADKYQKKLDSLKNQILDWAVRNENK